MFDRDDYWAFRKKIEANKYYPYVMSVLRALLIYLIYVLTCFLTIPSFRKYYSSITAEFMVMPNLMRIIFETILLFLMLNSVILTFAIYHKSEREAFLEIHKEAAYLFDARAERKNLLRSSVLAAETVALWAFFAVFPMPWGYDNAVLLMGNIPVLPKLIATLVFAVASFLIMLHSRIDARKMWLEMPERLIKKHFWKSMARKKRFQYSYFRMLLRLVGYTLLYAALMQIVAFVIAMLSSVLRMLKLVLLTPIILGIVLAFFSLFYLRAIRTRSKFVRNLKKTCTEEGYDLFYLKRPYRSIFRDNGSYTFALEANGKTYYCRMLASVKRSNKLIISDDGTCTRLMGLHIPQPQLVRVGGFLQAHNRGNGDDREFMNFSSIIDYTFEADGHKILIINPVPKRVLRKICGATREMDNGDKIGEYTVYTGNAFLRALKRESAKRRARKDGYE